MEPMTVIEIETIIKTDAGPLIRAFQYDIPASRDTVESLDTIWEAIGDAIAKMGGQKHGQKPGD